MPWVPIVDTVVAYDCPHSNRRFMLITRNALHIKSIDNTIYPAQYRNNIEQTTKTTNRPDIKSPPLFFNEESQNEAPPTAEGDLLLV